LPTCLAAAAGKIETVRKLDGVNLLPYLTGKNADRPHDTLYWRFGEQWAIRKGDFKLVVSSIDGPEPRLFNLAKDIGEATDLSAKLPDKMRELKSLWDAWNAEQAKPLWDKGIMKKKKKDKEEIDDLLRSDNSSRTRTLRTESASDRAACDCLGPRLKYLPDFSACGLAFAANAKPQAEKANQEVISPDRNDLTADIFDHINGRDRRLTASVELSHNDVRTLSHLNMRRISHATLFDNGCFDAGAILLCGHNHAEGRPGAASQPADRVVL